jgi:hypothetical protein
VFEALQEVDPSGIVVPGPELDVEPPEPLFTTDDDFATGSLRLIAYKKLSGIEDKDLAD